MKKDSLEARYEQIMESAARILNENNKITVGSKVKVEIVAGRYDFKTGMETKPPTYATGVVQKISNEEGSVHSGDNRKFYTVKFKDPITRRTEIRKFEFVTPV